MTEQNRNGGSPTPAESGAVRVRHGDVILTFGKKNSFTYTIRDAVGIHARPAGALVKLAKQYKSRITVSAHGKSAGADSILALMSLGAKQGTQLEIAAQGEDEREALEAFRTFLYEHL